MLRLWREASNDRVLIATKWLEVDPLNRDLAYRDDGGAITVVIQTVHAETDWTC